MKLPFLFSLLILLQFPAIANDGKHLPSPALLSDSNKTIDGFSAMLMITSDRDWQEKWNTPEKVIPKFNTTDSVALGDTITILTIFSNPATTPDGFVKIRCDLKMIKPGGVLGTDMKDVLCFPEVKLPNPRNVQLTSLAVMFQAEPSDPKGVWTAEVVVHDIVGKRDIPLKTMFTVK
jgi:hypothetical protein